jgi:serine/threonine protein kinase
MKSLSFIAVGIRTMHRRGILHKDIKPANVLANSATASDA